MASLESSCEQALLQLLESIPALAAAMPRHSEYYGDVEPSQEVAGNLKNPNLSVMCSKNGEYVQQTVFFKINCETTLWVDTDEQTVKQGIDDLFHEVESLYDDPYLHQTLMLNANNRAVLDIEYTRTRATRRSAQSNRYERVYTFEMIAAAKQ